MRELLIASPLVAFAIIFGVYPNSLLYYMQPSVDKQVEQLAAWTETYDGAKKSVNQALGAGKEQMASTDNSL